VPMAYVSLTIVWSSSGAPAGWPVAAQSPRPTRSTFGHRTSGWSEQGMKRGGGQWVSVDQAIQHFGLEEATFWSFLRRGAYGARLTSDGRREIWLAWGVARRKYSRNRTVGPPTKSASRN
jgi:hypothetical protein